MYQTNNESPIIQHLSKTAMAIANTDVNHELEQQQQHRQGRIKDEQQTKQPAKTKQKTKKKKEATTIQSTKS